MDERVNKLDSSFAHGLDECVPTKLRMDSPSNYRLIPRSLASYDLEHGHLYIVSRAGDAARVGSIVFVAVWISRPAVLS